MVLNRKQDKATLGFFEKRLVFLVEVDISDEAEARGVDLLGLWRRVVRVFLFSLWVLLRFRIKGKRFYWCYDVEFFERRGDIFAGSAQGHARGQ